MLKKYHNVLYNIHDVYIYIFTKSFYERLRDCKNFRSNLKYSDSI